MKVISEDELDGLYGTKARLASGGDYGCMCVVLEGDVTGEGAKFCDDAHFRALQEEADVGTVVVTGNLTLTGDVTLSDRLFCLVVLGDVTANVFTTSKTEVLVGGALKARTVVDADELITVENGSAA
ncbi:MAG: hypothetical protein DI536_32585 [Archangium gephyra]|uniref:Polymer-forming cytoskeletal protein n=1 Tax=Archangium gephyra TaxID=48 RepID=A0A2W5T1B9_9BACT|nr:MAG: hypothetical protein DI536_32585 [Archangium gephyra]